MKTKNKKGRIPDRAYRDIVRFAKNAEVQKLVLFGSRARRDNQKNSDIDLAVYGGDFDRFYWDIQEKTWSLLQFDLVDMGETVSEELLNEIRRDGVVIYEKIDNFCRSLEVLSGADYELAENIMRVSVTFFLLTIYNSVLLLAMKISDEMKGSACERMPD